MPSKNIPSDWVAEAIRDFVSEAEQADYVLASEVASTTESMWALPLWFDWNGGVAIRPNGDLIGFLWGKPELAKIEDKPYFKFLACVAGASKYAELRSLLPLRTEHDRSVRFVMGPA